MRLRPLGPARRPSYVDSDTAPAPQARRVQKPKQRHDIYYCTVCNVGVTLDKDPTKFVKFSAYYRNYQRKCKACRAAAAQTAVVADSE